MDEFYRRREAQRGEGTMSYQPEITPPELEAFENCILHSSCVFSEASWSDDHPDKELPTHFHCRDLACEEH
jgi:hypothetical protein